MADLNRIPHCLDPKTGVCRAVIETPKGRRAKYTYEAETGAFELTGLLPEGMAFPLDFGFVPSTEGGDGDPLDVLVLFDEPCAVGAVVEVRLIGVIEAEQTEQGQTMRNDRLLSVGCESRLYTQVRKPDDLGQAYIDNLAQFWVQYNALKDKRFKVLAVRGPKAAMATVRRGSVAGHTAGVD